MTVLYDSQSTQRIVSCGMERNRKERGMEDEL